MWNDEILNTQTSEYAHDGAIEDANSDPEIQFVTLFGNTARYPREDGVLHYSFTNGSPDPIMATGAIFDVFNNEDFYDDRYGWLVGETYVYDDYLYSPTANYYDNYIDLNLTSMKVDRMHSDITGFAFVRVQVPEPTTISVLLLSLLGVFRSRSQKP